MPVSSRIGDSTGRGYEARVTSGNALQVASVFPEIPTVGTANRYRYFNELLGSTGAGSGTTNMSVDGSSTAQEFYIGGHDSYDLHIMQIQAFVGDSTSKLQKFGAISALGTGWDLKVRESDEETYLVEKATTSGEILSQMVPALAWGDATTVFELPDYNSSNNDAVVVVSDIGRAVPLGIRLGRGTQDRITSVVNDDLTGLVKFAVRVVGFRHYPEG